MAELDNISKLQSYEDYIANNITEWEAESIARVCRKIGKIGRMTKKELEKFDANKEAKKEWERIVAALAIATALNIRSLKKVYTAEFEDWHTANKYLYDYRGIDFVEIAKNKQMQGIIDDFVKQNGKDILNLTNTKALRVLDRNGTPIAFEKAIQKAFSEAVDYVKNGQKNFYGAMQQTALSLGGGGCKIDYGEGITRRLDTVVRQNLMYGIKQSNIAYTNEVSKELKLDGVEIDFHTNSRPSHEFMQGRQFVVGKSKTINGEFWQGTEDVDPTSEDRKSVEQALGEFNCRHFKKAIICGVSEPTYSKTELERLKSQNAKKYRVGEVEGNGYFWSQKMRAIETDIRKSKDEINALSALGGNETKIKELKSRIKTFQEKYDEISDITGVTKEKRRLTAQKPQNILTSNTNNSIIEKADIQIAKSLGAAAFRDKVLLPNGNTGKIQEGSKITKVVTFAGKGTNKPVKVANLLSKQYKDYNVKPSEWQKSRGDGYVVCDDGITRHAELHWFESKATGRIKMKVKRYFDDEN